MRFARVIIVIGALLLVGSARPLFLMAREIVVGARVAARYKWIPSAIGNIDSSLEASVGGHRVQLLDDIRPTSSPSLEVQGPVRIVIDGRDYSQPAPARIRPAFTTPSRYHGSVFLARLADKKAGREYVVVAQSSRAGYRILWIDSDGRVTEDVFGYGDLCAVPVRSMIARHVTSHPIGYCSDIMQSWPSLLFPVLYPWTSGVLGVGLTIFGLIRLRRRR